MIDSESLKKQSNIVDVIAPYVQLKRRGTSHSGLCPFHNEKSPSFNVSESKQVYYCFGCGATGDMIEFLMAYHNWDFHQAAKELGADVESKPLEYIARNERRVIQSHRLPQDHQQDEESSIQALQLTESNNSDDCVPVATAQGDIVNVYCKSLNQCLFGDSYNGAHWIIKNDKPSAIAVTSYDIGNTIASKYNFNVAVCFTDAILKYMCKWNHGEYKLKPALTADCDDYLAFEMPWLFWDGEKLEKRGIR